MRWYAPQPVAALGAPRPFVRKGSVDDMGVGRLMASAPPLEWRQPLEGSTGQAAVDAHAREAGARRVMLSSGGGPHRLHPPSDAQGAVLQALPQSRLGVPRSQLLGSAMDEGESEPVYANNGRGMSPSDALGPPPLQPPSDAQGAALQALPQSRLGVPRSQLLGSAMDEGESEPVYANNGQGMSPSDAYGGWNRGWDRTYARNDSDVE